MFYSGNKKGSGCSFFFLEKKKEPKKIQGQPDPSGRLAGPAPLHTQTLNPVFDHPEAQNLSS
jgi:hypothetical protein